MKSIAIKSDKKYSIEDVLLVAKNKVKVIIDKNVLQNVKANFTSVKKMTGQNIYGLTTGVGDLSINQPTNTTDTVQKSILLSHSVGMGENLPKEIIRAIIFSRLLMLSKGMSGVSTEMLFFLKNMLNEDIVPIVPSLGSIGSSDLTILAGIFVTLCNKGFVMYKDKKYKPFDAFELADIAFPKKLQNREGLALINGNNGAIGLGTILLNDLEDFLQTGLEIAALSLEARGGTYAVYNPANQNVRQFKGQKNAANILSKLLKDSQRISDTYENTQSTFLQDPPSFKTIAQVFGNAFDTLENARKNISIELNGIVDNPLFVNNEVISSGNYLAIQLATTFDNLSLTIASISAFATARIKILLNNEYNEGLPSYLINDSTNNSGFMIFAYTAESILSEIKALLYPRSTFDISVANGWEDVSSNAFNAGLNTRRILNYAKKILLLEEAISLQAIALRKQKKSSLVFGAVTSEIVEKLQKKYKYLPLENDEQVNNLFELLKEREEFL